MARVHSSDERLPKASTSFLSRVQ